MEASEILDDVKDRIIHFIQSNETAGGGGGGNVESSTTESPFFADDEFFHPNVIHDRQICKAILHQKLGQVKVWDLLIFLPNLAFLIFVLYKMPGARQKLRATNSPVFKAFYLLIVTNSLASLVRCVVSMAVNSANPANDTADKVLWILVRFFLVSTEISVVVFGLAFGRLDSKSSIKRVMLVAVLVSFVFCLVQGYLELYQPDYSYYVIHTGYDIYGSGGSTFWAAASCIIASLYCVILCLPVCPIKSVYLPHKKTFYVYSGFLCILYLLSAIGALLQVYHYVFGLCLQDMTSFIYFTLFTPLVYIAFMQPFFTVAQPNLLFSYRAQVDEIEENLPSSISVQSLQHTPQESTIIRQQANGTNDSLQTGLMSPESANGDTRFLIQ